MTAPDLLTRVRAIDAELVTLYARVDSLLRERAWVVARLVPPPSAGSAASGATGVSGGTGASDGTGGSDGTGASDAIGAVGWTGGRAWPDAGSAAGRVPGPGGARPGRETAPVTAQTVLLALGGLLLGTAAVVFTVVAWSRAGLAGRALVLLAITLAALSAPALLLRRRLAATAETVAAVGLLLCLLDAYAVRRLDVAGLGSVDGGVYVAGVLALLAVGCAGYGALLPLRGPRPAAVVLAQLPLPLLALSAGASPAVLALALLGGPLLDLALARGAAAAGVRRAATLSGVAGWSAAVLVAGLAAFAADGVPVAAPGVLVLAGLLALAAAAGTAERVGGAGVGGARSVGGTRSVGAGGSVGIPGRLVLCLGVRGRALAERGVTSRSEAGVGLGVLVLTTAAICVGRVPLEAAVTGAGVPLAAAVVGLLVALVALALPVSGRRGPLGAAGVVLGLTAAAPLGAVVGALSVPLATAGAPWHGVPAPVTAATMAPGVALMVTALVTAGLAVAALATGPLLRPVLRPAVELPTGRRPDGWGLAGAVVAGGVLAAAVLAPVALDLTLAATLVLLGALTGATAALGSRHGRVGLAGAGLAAPLATLTVGYGLAAEAGTLAVLAALAVLTAALAGTAARTDVRTGAAAVAVLALAGEAAAVPLAAGTTVRPAGFFVLGVVAAAVAAAAALRRTAPAESLALELAAVPAAVAGVALAATRGWTASAAFGVIGLILAAAALRPDRRPLTYPAAAAVQLAGWIALATAEVSAPEAYTVPLSAALLVVGLLRRRAAPASSSWLAYGPAITVTALPSLAAALAGGTALRPLLLGAAAVATVLLGARTRLQAPLVVGAAVLGVLAVHELGPALAGLTAELPRWLPPALGGALLLAVGSTYERRLAELRRARDAFTRLG